MDIRFRPASPADADSAVPLIYSSGPAAFDYVFKRKRKSALDFLRYAFKDGAGEMGYRNHVVGEREGKVVVVGAAYDGASGFPFFLAAFRQIVGFYGFDSLSVIVHGLQAEQVIEPPKGALHYIAHLGVEPALQSKGIGAQMIEHLMEEGRKLGKSKTGIAVSAQNPRAQALYERLGYKVVKRSESKYEGLADSILLTRDL